MAYKNSSWEIVSNKGKKKQTTAQKKVKDRRWNIVWWIGSDLKLKIGKVVEDSWAVVKVHIRGTQWTVEEVESKKIKEWNDDDYY